MLHVLQDQGNDGVPALMSEKKLNEQDIEDIQAQLEGQQAEIVWGDD